MKGQYPEPQSISLSSAHVACGGIFLELSQVEVIEGNVQVGNKNIVENNNIALQNIRQADSLSGLVEQIKNSVEQLGEGGTRNRPRSHFLRCVARNLAGVITQNRIYIQLPKDIKDAMNALIKEVGAQKIQTRAQDLLLTLLI